MQHAIVLAIALLAACSARAETPAERGEYLVNLLSCGYCHTDGALIGRPVMSRYLAGSAVGIAYTPYRDPDLPAVVFPRNLTPDEETGLGAWTEAEIKRVIRSGIDRHGRQQMPVMPWAGYSHIRDEDLDAIVAYLRSLPAVRFAPPAAVVEGQKSPDTWVRFGVFQFSPDGSVGEHGIGEVRQR